MPPAAAAAKLKGVKAITTGRQARSCSCTHQSCLLPRRKPQRQHACTALLLHDTVEHTKCAVAAKRTLALRCVCWPLEPSCHWPQPTLGRGVLPPALLG